MTDITTLNIKKFRKATAALRVIAKNLDSGAIAGNGATRNAIKRHADKLDEATSELTELGDRRLVGLLITESDMRDRIRERQLVGASCPELKVRLSTATRLINLQRVK